MSWSWLPEFSTQLLNGLATTLIIFVVSVVVGFSLAIPLALAQIRGGWLSSWCSRWFCTALRGTPLLIQLFLFYYGLGSVFASMPMARELFPSLMRIDAIWYALLAFTLNFAAHEAEVLRSGLLDVPRGELEAAKSFGFSAMQVLRRIWLPSAVLRIYPVLANDVIVQLKSTPVAFVVPVVELMAVTRNVMQDRLLTYEPLLLVAGIYLILTFVILQLFAIIGRCVPTRWLE